MNAISGAVILATVVTHAQVAAPSSSSTSWIDEATKSWRRLEELYGSFEATCTVTLTQRDKVVSEQELVFKRSGEQWVLEKLANKKQVANEPTEQVFAVNEEYAFSLRRDSADESWHASFVGGEQGVADSGNALARDFFREPWTLGGDVSLPALVKDPRFRVVKFTDQADSSIVRLEFEFEEPPSDEDPTPPYCFYLFDRGWMEFDKANLWCLTAVNIQNRKSDAVGKYTIEYGPVTEAGVAFPMKNTFLKVVPSKNYTSLREVTYESFQLGPVTDADFRLSAYGLPEPPGESNWGNRFALSLLLLAVLLIVGALWLRKRHA